MPQVVIAGGGVVGLLTSLMLARDGHDVVVLDRDGPPPVDGGPDSDFVDWSRPGVPQAVHSHIFLARTARVLRHRTPDILDGLLDRGVTSGAHDFGPGFEDDMTLEGRRLVFEGVIRRAAQRQPGVEFRPGTHVTGLEADDVAGRRRVTGVRTRAGHVVKGHLVVDALGRRSPASRWLRELDVAPPVEERHSCGLHYFARHYRVRNGGRLPNETRPVVNQVPYGLFIVFGGDNDTFSLAGGLSVDDPHRAALRDPAVFDRVLGAIPTVQPYLDVAEPITDVHLMGSLANRRRRLLVDGRPPPDGYVLIGDSSIYTNATLGRGISLGFWQAEALVDALRRRDDPGRAASDVEAWTEQTLGPLFDEQVRVDADITETMRAGIDGAPLRDPPPDRRPLVAAARLEREGDPVVAPVVRRVRHLLTDGSTVAEDEAVQQRIHDYLDKAPALSPGHGVLSRAQFERLVES